MCGINGIYWYDHDKRVDAGRMAAMNDALAHRGPDNAGIHETKHLLLGHRRLSIIDLSEAGNQPFHSADKRYTIVYNGELYNYRELRDKLGNERFQTNTDTEVVLAAYEQWGASCLEQFNGMFAFAIWDHQRKSLFVARDRIGIKPLYFFRSDHYFVFASEVRALLASELIPRRLNRDALVDYLRYQTVHPPATMLEGVNLLLPGHHITLTEDEFHLQPWWQPTTHVSPRSTGKSYEAICADINELLGKAVERRLVADVPFGAFLSGGIDSSAIVGLMSKVSNQPVKTFSVVFDEKEFSEAPYSQLIARKFNTDHTEIHLTANDFLETIPAALGAMDHPSGDGPNTFIVSKVTKESGITMALSGLGGDELFAGYDIFKRSLELEKKRWLTSWPPFMRRAVAGVNRTLRPGVASDKIYDLLTLDYYDLDHTYPLSRQVLLDRYVRPLLDRKRLPANRLHELANQLIGYGNAGFDLPLLSQVSVVEMAGYMQNVLLRDTDQMSMAHALEVRVPFLDHELVEYVLGVRDQHKYPQTPKKLLTDSLGDLLPREIIDRPKMGFVFPWQHWMKNELRALCEERLTALGEHDAINAMELQKLWNRFQKGDPRMTYSRLWPLVVLSDWMTKHNIR